MIIDDDSKVIVTPGGRLISILKNISLDPGDVDYVILYDDIPKLHSSAKEMMGDGPLLNKHMNTLIELGLIRKL